MNLKQTYDAIEDGFETTLTLESIIHSLETRNFTPTEIRLVHNTLVPQLHNIGLEDIDYIEGIKNLYQQTRYLSVKYKQIVIKILLVIKELLIKTVTFIQHKLKENFNKYQSMIKSFNQLKKRLDENIDNISVNYPKHFKSDIYGNYLSYENSINLKGLKTNIDKYNTLISTIPSLVSLSESMLETLRNQYDKIDNNTNKTNIPILINEKFENYKMHLEKKLTLEQNIYQLPTTDLTVTDKIVNKDITALKVETSPRLNLETNKQIPVLTPTDLRELITYNVGLSVVFISQLIKPNPLAKFTKQLNRLDKLINKKIKQYQNNDMVTEEDRIGLLHISNAVKETVLLNNSILNIVDDETYTYLQHNKDYINDVMTLYQTQ